MGGRAWAGRDSRTGRRVSQRRRLDCREGESARRQPGDATRQLCECVASPPANGANQSRPHSEEGRSSKGRDEIPRIGERTLGARTRQRCGDHQMPSWHSIYRDSHLGGSPLNTGCPRLHPLRIPAVNPHRRVLQGLGCSGDPSHAERSRPAAQSSWARPLKGRTLERTGSARIGRASCRKESAVLTAGQGLSR